MIPRGSGFENTQVKSRGLPVSGSQVRDIVRPIQGKRLSPHNSPAHRASLKKKKWRAIERREPFRERVLQLHAEGLGVGLIGSRLALHNQAGQLLVLLKEIGAEEINTKAGELRSPHRYV
jgi:hypothetical protein